MNQHLHPHPLRPGHSAQEEPGQTVTEDLVHPDGDFVVMRTSTAQEVKKVSIRHHEECRLESELVHQLRLSVKEEATQGIQASQASAFARRWRLVCYGIARRSLTEQH